jgi:ABC-type amino acid transport substrate-binding protein
MSRYHRIFVALLVLVLLLSACKDKDDKKKTDNSLPDRLQEIQREGKLVVGTAITSPFEYHDPESNALVGFDVDLTNQIADRLDISVEWREMTFADLLPALQNGDVDMVIAAMYIKPEREDLVDFAQPYLDTGLVMAVQTGNTDITDLNSLAGHSVGVKQGSTGEAAAQRLRDEQGIDLTIQRYEETLDSLDDLDAGLVDVVFNDYNNTLIYIQTHPNIRLQGDIFEPAGLGIAVQTGDTDLLNFINETLTNLKQSGDVARLFNKWIVG